MLLCTRVILNFIMVKNEGVLESVERINETIALNMSTIPFHNLSNVESFHQQCDNDVFDEMHLQVMELQTLLWKPHNMMYMCWSFFVVNDDLPIDLVNCQMLHCINYQIQQAFGNILNQSSIIRKGHIKYSKTNGITPMKTHVDNVHYHLVVLKKLYILEFLFSFTKFFCKKRTILDKRKKNLPIILDKSF